MPKSLSDIEHLQQTYLVMTYLSLSLSLFPLPQSLELNFAIYVDENYS